jgi:hypothetical protein
LFEFWPVNVDWLFDNNFCALERLPLIWLAYSNVSQHKNRQKKLKLHTLPLPPLPKWRICLIDLMIPHFGKEGVGRIFESIIFPQLISLSKSICVNKPFMEE